MTAHVEFSSTNHNNGAICILYCFTVDKKFLQALSLMMLHLKVF